MLATILGLIAAATAPSSLAHEGGVCVGLSWVKLSSSENVSIQNGPDFDVFRFQGTDKNGEYWWAVYRGRFASATAASTLLKKEGITVRRAVADGKFDGYLVEKDGEQNHFFGPIFKDTSTDAKFFDRIDFGSNARSLCEKHPSGS